MDFKKIMMISVRNWKSLIVKKVKVILKPLFKKKIIDQQYIEVQKDVKIAKKVTYLCLDINKMTIPVSIVPMPFKMLLIVVIKNTQVIVKNFIKGKMVFYVANV